MAIPAALYNFPAGPTYSMRVHEFNRAIDLADWEWFTIGHTSPDTLTDTDGGGVTLGSGSASSGDMVSGQALGGSIQLNRLNKMVEVTFKAQLSSATLCKAMLGLAITTPNLIDSNITDGIGFYTNGTNWNAFVAFDSVTQYTTYSQQLAIKACDTSLHTFSIRIFTDPVTQGAGTVVFFIDSVQVGPPIVFVAAGLPWDELLRLSMAMENGSAAAQTLLVTHDATLDQY